jgi:hypothetical protein
MTATITDRLPTLLSGGETLLEGGILSLPGAINQKPADQTRAGSGNGSEPGVAADRTKYRAAACADRRAGHRALLGWCHIGASSGRQCNGREQQ